MLNIASHLTLRLLFRNWTTSWLLPGVQSPWSGKTAKSELSALHDSKYKLNILNKNGYSGFLECLILKSIVHLLSFILTITCPKLFSNHQCLDFAIYHLYGNG